MYINGIICNFEISHFKSFQVVISCTQSPSVYVFSTRISYQAAWLLL